MPALELPDTAGCLVCGRGNPHGLFLSLHVDPQSGIVQVQFTPAEHHIGFTGIVHGGVIATVVDEAMVWAATWSGQRFCVCAEMNVRFRNSARVGIPLTIEAKVDSSRGRVIRATATVKEAQGRLIAEASGKFMTVSPEQNRAFVETLVEDRATSAAAEILRAASV